jgi:hypothetical protein
VSLFEAFHKLRSTEQYGEVGGLPWYYTRVQGLNYKVVVWEGGGSEILQTALCNLWMASFKA